MLMVRATITTLKKKASTPWASTSPPQLVIFDLHVRDLEGHPDDKRKIHESPNNRGPVGREKPDRLSALYSLEGSPSP